MLSDLKILMNSEANPFTLSSCSLDRQAPICDYLNIRNKKLEGLNRLYQRVFIINDQIISAL